MTDSEKVRENRLRRVAERQGLALVKSRTRDPRALDYGRWGIVKRSEGGLPFRSYPRDWTLTLDEVEARLADGKELERIEQRRERERTEVLEQLEQRKEDG